MDKNTKIILFNHLNDKKVLKNKKLLIKSNYVLRILLELYRKGKRERLSKLQGVFEQTGKFTKC